MKPQNEKAIREVIHLTEERKGSGAALIEAVRWSISDEVLRLLDAGIDVDTRSPETQTTPLMAATDPKIAELLVKRGADVNAVDASGRTPLVWYLKGLNKKSAAKKYVRALLSLGARVPCDLNEEESPFIHAREKYGEEIVELLRNAVLAGQSGHR